MDESHRQRPAKSVSRARPLAFLVMLAVAGCKQLGIGQTKVDNPVVPPPPERKVLVDSQTSSAKPAAAAAPLKLDGSAAGDGAPAIPNAPGIDGAPILAGTPSASGQAADHLARLSAVQKEEAAVTKSDTHPAETGGQIESEDEPPGQPPAGEAPERTGASGAAGALAASGGPVKHADFTSPSVREIGASITPIELASDAGDDVVPPIEIEGAGANFVKGQIAATVNGVPIFVDDVLRAVPDEIARELAMRERAAAEGKMKPEDYRNYRRMVVEHYMKDFIQQELLLQALKLKLKEEQLSSIRKQLDKMFDTEGLPAAIKKAGVTTAAELDEKLQAQGSSIEAIRTTFRNREMAHQYLGAKVTPNLGFDRPDALRYYQENLKSYAITAKAKWEQIQLKFSENGGREGALKKAEEVLKRLEAGEVFAVVARECSNGSTASKGGLWSWTEKGSVKAKEIDEALFELPVGEISRPIETQKSIDIIRVTDRTPAGHQPFEDVQEDIKNHLKNKIFMQRVNDLLKELTEKASIETFTDKL